MTDNPLEKAIESHLRKEVSKLGGEAYKFSSPQRRGVTDRIVVLPGRVPIFVEVKRAGGKLTALQEREQELLKRLGQFVFVVRSKDEIDWLLDQCLKHLPEVEKHAITV